MTDLNTSQKVYVWLTGFFVACLVIADIVGIKLFRLPLGFSIPVPWDQIPITAIEHTCGMITFPVTFILTDLINEYYGKKGARRVTWIGLVMAAFVLGVMTLSQKMPHPEVDYNIRKDHFDAVFGSSKIMFVSSLCAYLIGQMSDIFLFGVIKRLTGGRFIWLRATGSTLISQFIDSMAVAFLAFYLLRNLFPDPDSLPAKLTDALRIGLTGYLLKFVLAIGVTPIIYLGHAILRRVLGLTPLPPDERT
ncbi:Queuosine precursor transporter [Phycisphaerales bacterium]|nr:Queuosine precursor transporter [Phycisphaerales bacterium]